MQFRGVAVPAAYPRLRSNLHFIVVGAAALALVPALVYLRLPIAWPWRFVLGFSRGVAVQSICAAAVLYVVQHPAELRLLWRRYREPRGLLLLAAVCGAVVWRSGLHLPTCVKLVDAVVALELVLRWREGRLDPRRTAWAVLPAAIYFIAGFVLVFTYNEVIVSRRFYGAEDDALNRLDLRLFGTTVSAVAHRAAALLGSGGFDVIEALYYGMFAQLGATIVICGLGSGPRHAVRFVGAIMLAQALALTTFYLWPSHGPYYSCAGHFERWPFHSNTLAWQKEALAAAQRLWERRPRPLLELLYFVSFPCMHIAQPLISLWFLRRYRRMVAVLGAYDLLLIPAILLLEWHYFLDIFGGIAVAAAVVWVVYEPSTEEMRLSAAAPRPRSVTTLAD